MKVAFDISALGLGYLNYRNRSGVFRTVITLLLELMSREEIELHPVVLHRYSNIWDYISSDLYIRRYHTNMVKHVRSPHYSRNNLYASYRIAMEIISSTLNHHSFISQSAQALRLALQYIAKIDTGTRDTRNLYNIYHSPWYPLPERFTLGNARCIVTVYDLAPVLFNEFVTPKQRWFFEKLIASVDCSKDWVICISEYTKQDWCNYTGMNPDCVIVIPLAAADHFQPVTDTFVISSALQRYGIPDIPYILGLAVFQPRKNIHTLIQSFLHVITEYPGLELNLVLVGVSGWKDKQLYELLNKNPNLKARIIFTGYVDEHDLSALYSGAIAFTFPSLFEGFGLPVLEAMKCGTPVIASNTTSIPEVVGNAGILIDPMDKDSLCQAILKVVHDSELQKRMSLQSIQQASIFSWQRTADETIKVYQMAVGDSRC